MNKHKQVEWYIREGFVILAVDTRIEGVDVPKHLRGRHDVTLSFGYDLPIPIQDLGISMHGISGGLHFDKCGVYNVFLPWAAVYGLKTHRGDTIDLVSGKAPEAPAVAKVLSMADYKRRHAAKDGFR